MIKDLPRRDQLEALKLLEGLRVFTLSVMPVLRAEDPTMDLARGKAILLAALEEAVEDTKGL